MILCNFSNTDYHMAWYKDLALKDFLDENKIDGIELFLHGRFEVPSVLGSLTKGVHLSYFPTWLDFYQENHDYYEDFKTEEEVIRAYGGLKPEALVNRYKREFEISKSLDAAYMVFHVGHVKLKDVFKRNFDYTDKDVLEATADLVNKAFDQGEDEPSKTMLLFENLWWPGLQLTDKKDLEDFMDSIHYPNKGIMLDLSHLLLTNPRLDTYEKGIQYIKKVVKDLESASRYIKGIHINYTKCYDYLLSLEYEENKKEDKIFNHVIGLDQHLVFEDEGLKEIINMINPKFKVIEVKGLDQEDWETNVIKQRKYI